MRTKSGYVVAMVGSYPLPWILLIFFSGRIAASLSKRPCAGRHLALSQTEQYLAALPVFEAESKEGCIGNQPGTAEGGKDSLD